MQLWFKKHLFLIIILLAVVATLIVTRTNESIGLTDNHEPEALIFQDEEKSNLSKSEDSNNLSETDYIVDVKGEVQNPGVYTVGMASRVVDVIELAGGFTEKANQDNVNLAEKTYDEMVVFITHIDDDSSDKLITSSFNQSAKNGVRINQATEEEIATLNGIGPSKADAIITYREENGPFQTIEDLLNVSGIGEKTLENFKEDVIIP